MSYFTRYMDKCSRLHSFPVTRYIPSPNNNNKNNINNNNWDHTCP